MAATHVNSFTGGAFSGGVSQISVTGVQAGDIIAVGSGWGFTDTVTLTSVTDADGTYTVAQNLADAGVGRSITAYIKATSSGTHVVSVTVSTNPAFGIALAQLIRGIDGTNPLDNSTAQATNGGTGTDSVSSGALTPANNGSYLFGFMIDLGGNGYSFTAGTDYTPAPAVTHGLAEYFIQTTAASKAATCQMSGTSFDVSAHLLVFKADAGGGAPATPRKNPIAEMQRPFNMARFRR